jgi:hypothetical protein
MDNKCRRHGRVICSECVHVTDAAKRAYDSVRLHVHAAGFEERVRSWCAIRLEDGGSDGVLYASKQDAIRHQPNQFLCGYFSFRGAPNGLASYKDAAIWLAYHRHAYSRGFRLPDPDDRHGGPDLIMPSPRELVAGQLTRLMRAGVN